MSESNGSASMQQSPISSTLETRAVTRDVFSATIGSVCCCYVGQPFDTGTLLWLVLVKVGQLT
jgi:hypothetical protein